MYSSEFDYYRAGSVAEASHLLQKHPGAKLLAGGHSLIPLLKLRLAAPPALIDIGRIAELKGVTVTDGMVRIGALTTHAALAASDVLRKHCPMLAEAAQAGRRSGGAQPRHDRRQRGARRSRVGSADRAHRARRPIHGHRSGRHDDDRRRRLLHRHDGDGARRARPADGDRGSGAGAQGQGMAYVKFSHPASRYAVIGVAASADRQRRHLRVGGGGDWRPGPAADARGGGRTGADRTGAVRRTDRRGGAPGGARISDATSSATCTRRPSTARRSRRSGSSGRSPRRRRARETSTIHDVTIYNLQRERAGELSTLLSIVIVNCN